MVTAKGYWLSTAAAVFWIAFGILCLVSPVTAFRLLAKAWRRPQARIPEASQALALRLVGFTIAVGFLILLVGSLHK